MKIKDIMRTSVISVPQNASLKDVVRAFVGHHLDHLPVLDASERVVGLITVDELIDVFLPRYYEFLRDYMVLQDKGQLAAVFDNSFAAMDVELDEKLILAADLMRTDYHWVSNDDTLLQAACELHAQHVARLPVVDRDQKLVGLISDFEIVLALLKGVPSAVMPQPA